MIKAIETTYKGYRFRSRLEARWAVFFDAIKTEWEYEKEGYDLGAHGWYLPDFWLPSLRCWVEIKPDAPTWNERSKMETLSDGTDSLGCIVYGGTPSNKMIVFTNDVGESSAGSCCSEYASWARCGACGRLYIDIGFDREFYYDTDFSMPYSYCGCRYRLPDSASINQALSIARSARFEHGEKPNV